MASISYEDALTVTDGGLSQNNGIDVGIVIIDDVGADVSVIMGDNVPGGDVDWVTTRARHLALLAMETGPPPSGGRPLAKESQSPDGYCGVFPYNNVPSTTDIDKIADAMAACYEAL